mmetsp:Transcript_28290/g.43189  ORF Transcript_28290/g.43189 Transcript_28290/m.43189 type:complete len:385 (+) Transcript_28290:77-1231(+)
MFFSTDKHKEIREENETKGVEEKTTNIAKLVSQAWKSLSTTDRSKWEDLARKDKLRYELEKSTYTGPWKIPAKEFSKKDPGAPKRPMSAFLAFSHKNRASVKASMKDENNDTGPTTLTNAELSRVLARMWKDASDEEKKEYIDTEYKLRQKYLKEIAVWREEKQNEFQDQRKQREEVALQFVAARGDNPMIPGPNEPQYHQHVQQQQQGRGEAHHYHSQQSQYENYLQGTTNHGEYFGAQYAYNSLAGAPGADRAYYMHAAAAAAAHQQTANSDSQPPQAPNAVTPPQPPPPAEYYSEVAAAYPPAYAYGGDYGGHPAYYAEEAHYYQQAAAANGEHYPYSLPPTYAAAPHEDHAQQQQVPPQQPPSHHAPSAPEGHYNQWSSV